MSNLDFIVIGAQKCATTTLFELLRQHPDIAMPLEKEVPLFTDTAVSAETLQDFADVYFGTPDGRLRGKVTPQYMGDIRVPERIARHLPECKLIAVLRDPVSRSRSHFRMGQRRGQEHRDFEQAVAELMRPEHLTAARAGTPPTHAEGYESEADFYLAWSEYGRILAQYRLYFPAAQMLVVYSEDLQGNPDAVLDQILAFLGVTRDFAPTGLGEVMHAGGGSNKIPHGLRVWLRQQTLISALWSRIPPQQQGRVRFLYERWNTKKTPTALPLSDDTERRLRAHFAADLARLESLQLPRPPWLDQYVTDSSAADLSIAAAAAASPGKQLSLAAEMAVQ